MYRTSKRDDIVHFQQNAILTDAYLRGIMDRLGDKVLPDSPVPDGYVDYQK